MLLSLHCAQSKRRVFMDFKVNTSRLYIIVQQVQYRRRRPLALTLLFSETLEGRENKEAQIDLKKKNLFCCCCCWPIDRMSCHAYHIEIDEDGVRQNIFPYKYNNITNRERETIIIIIQSRHLFLN